MPSLSQTSLAGRTTRSLEDRDTMNVMINTTKTTALRHGMIQTKTQTRTQTWTQTRTQTLKHAYTRALDGSRGEGGDGGPLSVRSQLSGVRTESLSLAVTGLSLTELSENETPC
jgi:hypothetical protein